MTTKQGPVKLPDYSVMITGATSQSRLYIFNITAQKMGISLVEPHQVY